MSDHSGVGSSALAALRNGRLAFGCDTQQRYVDITHERIAELRSGILKVRSTDAPVL